MFTGDAFVPFIDEVAFVSTMEIAGPMLDIDNFAHYLGIPPLTWVKAEPVSGVVPSGTSIPLKIHLTAAGLPIAIEFLGRPFQESRLIEIAHAYEQARGARVAPNTTPPLPGDAFAF